MNIREAELKDFGAFKELIKKLAEFERLEELLTANDEELKDLFFLPDAKAKVLLAEENQDGDSGLLGFAIYSFRISSFRGKKGLFLEDLFVVEAHRRRRVGSLSL